MFQATIRLQVILSHCIYASEVRGGRLESRTNAPAAATQNGRLGQGQSPGAGHDGPALLWLRRRSSCRVALTSAGLHARKTGVDLSDLVNLRNDGVGQDGIYQALGFGLKGQSESCFPSSY